MNFLMTLISENYAISLVLIVFIGALCGEVVREIDDDIKMIPKKFISSWIKSIFGGLFLGLMLQLINISPLIKMLLVLYISYKGHTKSLPFIDSIFEDMLKVVKDKIVKSIDNKK